MPETTQWEQIYKIQVQMSESLSTKIVDNRELYVSDIVPYMMDILMCTKQKTSFQDR